MSRPMKHCDCCGKLRADVKSVGRDPNGDPDAPDACFLCRVEWKRGNVWNWDRKRYEPATVTEGDHV